MKNLRFAGAVAVAVTVALAVPAAAEAQIPGVGIRIGGGPAFPVGHLADDTEAGFNALASLSLGIPLFPVAVRGDALFMRLPDVEGGNFQSISGSLNGVYRLPGLGLTPYLIGGVGIYNTRFTEGADHAHDHGVGATTNIGGNIGAGLQLSVMGFGAFIEARYHHLFHEGEATRFVPVTIGVTF